MTLRSEVSDLTLTLTQSQAAPVLLRPDSVTVQEGDDVILSVPLAAHSGQPTSIVWTRRDEQLLGERYSSSTQRGAVNLTVRNATVEDAGRYSLVAHNDAGKTHSDLLLEVRTRPGDVPVFLRRLNDLAVKVGTRTRFLVEVRSPTQVKVSWEQEGKPVLEGERFHLLHEGSFFCVDVAPVTLEDAGIWICRAHNSNGISKCFCHLNVLVPKAYKAPQFVEELVALLTQQGTVSLECKVVGVPTPTLKWFKDNQEIKAGDVFALSANPEDATSLGTYTCEATNCMGKAYSTSKVHVMGKEGGVQPADSLIPKGPPPVFSKELRNEKAKIGGHLTLECKVAVPPWPKSITWFNKGGLVEGGEGSRYHMTADGLGSYSVEIDQIEAVDDGEWKCVATSNKGVKGISSCSVTVSYPKNYKKPKFLESLKAILTEEGLVSFECKVVGYPTPHLRWFKDGQELKPGDVYQLTGTNSLGSYCCIAKNCMGETSSTAELTVEDIQSQLNEEERLQLFSTNQPPRFLQGLKSLEAKITDPLRFTVQVSVSPQPTVAWYRDDEEVQESDRYKKEQETRGVCHLVIKKLELLDQAEWKCVATNDYGQSVTSCFLKLTVPRHYKKPRFLENLRAVLSEEGAVNLECKVIGVPQPTLKWYKDGRELKPGDIHRIISGQDGTCCLGTYTCEASNCMGTVSSSASLLGFEDRGQVKPSEPLRPLPPPPAHLVRQTSLSTIQEERTSQMHDSTLDERAEVSFSFDGKEVSVSLYETPDLTEEEALQVVEMYAEELSEHISEHNVVELPPLRFVKETSTSGHLLMEAVVIDVSPEYYASAEDRTEADLDEFSITEDNNGFMSPMVLTPDEMPFEKFTADFLERTIQPISSIQQPIPIKPPRKRVADTSESSYHSFKEAKVSPEEESSEQFVDALSSQRDKSQKESLASVRSSSENKRKAITDVEQVAVKHSDVHTEIELNVSLRESDGKLSEEKKLHKKSRSRSRSTEKQSSIVIADDGTIFKEANSEKKNQKRQLKKRKSTDSEKEDDSLREFEKRKTLKPGLEQQDNSKSVQQDKKVTTKKNKSSESEREDDSLQEFESRKSLQNSGKIPERTKNNTYFKKPASDSSGREDDSLIEYEKRKISSDVLSDKVIQKTERQKIPLSKSISTDSSEKDDILGSNSETSEQIGLRKKRKKSVKKAGSIEKRDQPRQSEIEVPPLSEAESIDRESSKGIKGISTSDLDRMRSTSDLESIGDKSKAQEEEERSADFDTAEDSAYDKSEMSVLESLTHSIQEIQKGLLAVGEKIISESSEEPQSAKSSLSIIESLVQPINEIQQGLVKVEKIAEESKAGQYSPSSILETLKEPIQELERNLAVIEQKNITDSREQSLYNRTSQSLLETVSQPLHELHKELAFIQQQAVIETGEETYSEMLQSFKPSLLVVQGGVEHTEREFSSKLDDITEKTTIPQATYAHSTVELDTEVHMTDQEVSQSIQHSESFVPLTVQDVEESFGDSILSQQSVCTIKDINIHNELQLYSLSLEKCTRLLKEKAQLATDNEIKDILHLISNLSSPLEQFRSVIEKCLLTVVEDDQSMNPQLRSENLILKAALKNAIHAFGSSVSLLEIVANSDSNKEIRGLGIHMLYKLSFPLEELTTTIKLVENLSEHTSVELLTTPVEHLVNAANIIKPEISKTGFAENISKEGVMIIRALDDAVGTLSNSLHSMAKSIQGFSSLSSLSSLCRPLGELQKNLHKLENKIMIPEKCYKLNSSELYNLAQDLCKPLQAVRTELSLAQHEIELDQYGHLSLMSDHLQDVNPESISSVVLQSLDQVHKSVLTSTEFVLSKSLNESSYIRFLLFALNELILPFAQLNANIKRTEDFFLKNISKQPEPTTGIQVVTSSAKDLLDALSELQLLSTNSLSMPETAVIEVLCTMTEPLIQVQYGLHRIIENIHEKDKQILNINMLKTLAEPFKCLQKSLINISEKLNSQNISQEIFLEVRQPIQELQRSILIIQDQVSFEYGDEPATMESNIVTLQSLVQPLNALKKQFLEIGELVTDKTQSSSYSKENKNLHSMIRVNHELQLKISSIMVQENYLSKHSLDSLDMFPIFQDLSGLLKDFENALKRVDLICQNESKPDLLFHNKLSESVISFRSDMINFHNRLILSSNKAIGDIKHPVHLLKKGTESFLSKLSFSADVFVNCNLDELSIVSGYLNFCKSLSSIFGDFLEYLIQMENASEEELSLTEDISKVTTDIFSASFSDTIKDVHTIVDDITQTRVSLESVNIPIVNSTTLFKVTQELQTFCESLKLAEESLVENTLLKISSSSFNNEEEKRVLLSAFSSMKVQLEKIETFLTENHEALESVNHLKYTLDVIQEHLTFGEDVSEVYILQNLSGPLKTFKDTISKDSAATISEIKESESISLYLERFEKSSSDLELGLMKLEHALLNSTGDSSSLRNVDIDVLAHPIKELVQYINNIKDQQISLDLSESVGEQSSLTMLTTLALPIQEIQEGVLQIQEQIILESSGSVIPRKSCASILYEIAKPIRELRCGVALIQEQVVIEADVEPLSEDTKVSSLKTLAEPVEELKKVLTTIIEQQAHVIEPELQSLSENISILKTIATPVKELQNKLASIEINQIMEGNIQLFSAQENLLELAKPIYILQESIAQVENQLSLETLGDDVSVQTNISLLKKVAKPLQEVAKHIAIVTAQQFVEDVNSEDNITLSDLSTLANVSDISLACAVLNINENVVLEQELSFKVDPPELKLAETVKGKELDTAVIEEQQELMTVGDTSENNLNLGLENIDQGHIASVIKEDVCSPLIEIQQIMSKAETLSANEAITSQFAEAKDVSCNVAVQIETQEVLSPATNFTIEEPQFELETKQEISLNIAVQVEAQEALLKDNTFTCNDDSFEMKCAKEDFEPAFVVQGELQQSLADIESLATEEETIKSISIEETSFRIEPQVNIQQPLSGVESFTVSDESYHVAEIKNDIHSALQNEVQQVLFVEENFKLSQESSDFASIKEATSQFALQAEENKCLSNVDDLNSKEIVGEYASFQQNLLEEAVQVESQQMLSNVESLSSDSGITRNSQAVAMEESLLKLPVYSQVLEFISVAENIERMKDGLKAKITNEPLYCESVQQEIQEIVTVAEGIKSIKEALQVVCADELSLQTATQSTVQEILHSNEKVQNLKEVLERKSIEELTACEGLNVELQEILSTAQSLEALTQVISSGSLQTESQPLFSSDSSLKGLHSSSQLESLEALVVQHKKNDSEYILKSGKETEETVREDNSLSVVENLIDKSTLSEKTIPQFSVQSKVEDFISVANDIKHTTEALKTQISTESVLQSVQQEFQQIFSIAEEIQSVNEYLQIIPVENQPLVVADQLELQPLLTVFESLKTVEEAIQAQSGAIIDIKTVTQSELQQILHSAKAIQNVKKTLSATITHIEPLDEKVTVYSEQVLTSSPNLEDRNISQQIIVEKEQPDVMNVSEVKSDILLQETVETVESATLIEKKPSSEISNIQETSISSDTKLITTENLLKIDDSLDKALLVKKDEGIGVYQKSVVIKKEDSSQIATESKSEIDVVSPMKVLPSVNKECTPISTHLTGGEIPKVLEIQETTITSDTGLLSTEYVPKTSENSDMISVDKSDEHVIIPQNKGEVSSKVDLNAASQITPGFQLEIEAVSSTDMELQKSPTDEKYSTSTQSADFEVSSGISEVLDVLENKIKMDNNLINNAENILKMSEVSDMVTLDKNNEDSYENSNKIPFKDDQKVIPKSSEEIQLQNEEYVFSKESKIPLQKSSAVDENTSNYKFQPQTSVFSSDDTMVAENKDTGISQNQLNTDVQKSAMKEKADNELLVLSDTSSSKETTTYSEMLGLEKAQKDNIYEQDSQESILAMNDLVKQAKQIENDQVHITDEALTLQKRNVSEKYVQEMYVDKSPLAVSSHDDVQEVLSAIDYLDNAAKALKSLTIQEPYIGGVLQTEIQQILLSTDNLTTFKKSLQATIVDEPFYLTSVNAEFQQILNAAETLKVIKETMQAKCTLEPNLPVAQNILPQIIFSTQQLDHVCVSIEAKISKVQSIQIAAESEIQQLMCSVQSLQKEEVTEAKRTLEPNFKMAAQVEFQEGLLSTKEVHLITDVAKASCTHAPCIQICAKKSGVASLTTDDRTKIAIKKDDEESNKNILLDETVKEITRSRTPENDNVNDTHAKLNISKTVGNVKTDILLEKVEDINQIKTTEECKFQENVIKSIDELDTLVKESDIKIIQTQSDEAISKVEERNSSEEMSMVSDKCQNKHTEQTEDNYKLTKNAVLNEPDKNITSMNETLLEDTKEFAADKHRDYLEGENEKHQSVKKDEGFILDLKYEDIKDASEVILESSFQKKNESDTSKLNEKVGTVQVTTNSSKTSVVKSESLEEEIETDQGIINENSSPVMRSDCSESKISEDISETQITTPLLEMEKTKDQLKITKNDIKQSKDEAENLGKEIKIEKEASREEIKVEEHEEIHENTKKKRPLEKSKEKTKIRKSVKIEDKDSVAEKIGEQSGTKESEITKVESKVVDKVYQDKKLESQTENCTSIEETTLDLIKENDTSYNKPVVSDKIEDKEIEKSKTSNKLEDLKPTMKITGIQTQEENKVLDEIENKSTIVVSDNTKKINNIEKSEIVLHDDMNVKYKDEDVVVKDTIENKGSVEIKTIDKIKHNDVDTKHKVMHENKEIFQDESSGKVENIETEVQKAFNENEKKSELKEEMNYVLDNSSKGPNNNNSVTKTEESEHVLKLSGDETMIHEESGKLKPMKKEGLSKNVQSKTLQEIEQKIPEKTENEDKVDLGKKTSEESIELTKSKGITDKVEESKKRKSVTDRKKSKGTVNVPKSDDKNETKNIDSKNDDDAIEVKIIKEPEMVKSTSQSKISADINEKGKEVLGKTDNVKQVESTKETQKRKGSLRKQISKVKDTDDNGKSIDVGEVEKQPTLLMKDAESINIQNDLKANKQIDTTGKTKEALVLMREVDDKKDENSVHSNITSDTVEKETDKEIKINVEPDKNKLKKGDQSVSNKVESKENFSKKSRDSLYSDLKQDKVDSFGTKLDNVEDGFVTIKKSKKLVSSSKGNTNALEKQQIRSTDETLIANKLFVDESSTSDYSSESYSDSYKIKKSQSYDTWQWIYEPETKSDEKEESQLITTKKNSENKYETASSTLHEKIGYQRRQAASKPVFCGRLVDRTAAQGSRLKVTCSLTGSPEPTVQWYKDGHIISDHRLRTRLSNGLASLEITEATLGDSGKYTCVARNTEGETSTTSTIKIFSYMESAPEAPVFTHSIKDQYKSSSDELLIECKVKGHPLPTVTWLKDSQPLRIASRYQQSVLTDGTCRLVIHGPEPSDSGLYKCVAENTVWSEQTSGFVMFEGREKHLAASRSLADTRVPRFTNILSDHVVREGGTVALQVAIKGTPKAEVTWYRDSQMLPKKSSRFRYLEDGGVYSLVMSDASAAEAGTYTCRASNLHGYRDTSVNVQIVGGARGKPAMFISRPDTSMNIAVGEDITISFRVSGDPKPRVTWMKGMKDITNNFRTLKETVNDYVRLSLKHATIMDSGTYFITAKNIYGTDHAFVTVRVRQRARSLTPTRSIWSGPDTSTLLRDIHESTRALVNDVPGPVGSEATVSDAGKNWVSLTWGKPENRGAAPVLAYRVEAWLIGSEGGAHWTELGVTPINSFDAFFLKPGGEYKFRITARNRYGWGESVTSTNSVTIGTANNYPPDILRDLPGPLKALQGDNVTLECEVGGDPPPYVQWLRDGQDVSTIVALRGRVFVSDSQLIHRLILKQLSEDDSGRYVCEAVNKLGRASTYARLLVVSDPRLLEADRKLKEDLAENQELAPQVTMRLRDRRVQATYPVRLSCQVVGNPTPTVSWAHEGNTISSDDRHQLVAEADHFHTLEICRTVLEDGGQYTVTAQNDLGAVSCHCQLTVDKGIRAYVAPDFTSELESTVTVREGADLHLFAQVEAYPTVGIAWHRDGVKLRPSRRLVMTADCEGRLQLSLAGVTAREAGLYCCIATNAVGRAQTSGQVVVTSATTAAAASLPTVLAPSVPYSKEPRFVTKPRCSEAVEGDTVIITCEVVGDPQPDVMWLRDWLKPGYYRDAPQFRQAAGGCQYSLEIPQVKLDFTGTYCVIATNPHGEAKAIISLQIYAKGQGKESSMVSGHVKHAKVETLPEIKRELKDLRCCDGDSATLECLVLATPPPAVRWEKDGKLLPLGEDIEAAVDGEVARLTIKKVYPEDEGQYSCVAYNELGRAVTTACLVVDVPEEKETLLSQQLSRPPGLLSTRSTPRSTPRNTPSPARSVSPLPSRYREFSSPSYSRPKRIKMSSPKFYTVPHNRIAEEGETVRFQCSVAGHPIPWASWDKDGHIVTPSARLSVTERDDLRTLELREVTVEDAGLYRVTLENEMGSVEATARLDVIGRQGSRTRSVRAWSAMRASPTFGRRLVGSAARVGGTFNLTCDVHASPSPITSWYRNGEMLVMSDRVVPSWDGRRARLELRGLQPEDAGVYTCVAENSVGTTQCSAELRVLHTTDPSDADLQPPVFLQGLLPELTMMEGQPLELQTRLQGSMPMEVVWVKDGVEVPDCEDFRHVDYGDGRYGLRIADLFVADAGIYNCEAFNDHGDAITSGHLIVNDPAGPQSLHSQEPEICFNKTPSPVIARLRGPATFCARLQGNSLSLSHTSFTWTVGGRTVSSADHRCQVTTEGDCSVLHITEVCAGDAGAVTCTARVCSPGVPPTTVSCETHLGLDCTPGSPATLLRGPSDTTVMRGDRVLLKATYRGSPEPQVRWLKAGRELRTEGRVQIVSHEGVSCLTVSAITADDSGKYVVSVENIHGADCHFASVAVEGPPEPPAARPSVSRGPGCATVAWSSPAYDGGCVLTGYRVEMRTADSQDWSVIADRCHSLSYVVRDLAPGQTYIFRVRAENIHGASDSSAESFPFTLDSPDQGDEEDEQDQKRDEEGEESILTQVSLESGEQFLQRYSVHEELGKGRYGVVHKVTDLRSQHTMAAKFVRCIKKQDREKVQEEIDIMNCLRHPKLLQLAAAFENPKEIVMIMEYISGGELFERVVADDFTLTERDCILFLRQICEGVSYMHQSHVVHLDLKPENIMCHTRTSHRIKIIDFGLAQKLESGTPVRVLFGTPEFIPPEIINYEPIGVETDMWSVGVICYVLLSGLSPFMGDNDAETFANITRADYDFDDEAFDAISQDAKDFISALLVKRKENRLTAEECLQHQWMTQCDMAMSCVKLSTDKLKKFIIRRKWQKTGNAIRALGRMATLSAASRRNSSGSSPPSPRPSLATSRLSSLGEEEPDSNKTNRARMCSERSDSGISDCSSINTCAPRPLLGKKYSICEEPECDPSSYSIPGVNTNRSCDSVNGKVTSGVSVAAKIRTTSSLRPFAEPPAKAPSPTLQKDAKLFSKNENFQKAFAFWKQ